MSLLFLYSFRAQLKLESRDAYRPCVFSTFVFCRFGVLFLDHPSVTCNRHKFYLGLGGFCYSMASIAFARSRRCIKRLHAQTWICIISPAAVHAEYMHAGCFPTYEIGGAIMALSYNLNPVGNVHV